MCITKTRCKWMDAISSAEVLRVRRRVHSGKMRILLGRGQLRGKSQLNEREMTSWTREHEGRTPTGVSHSISEMNESLRFERAIGCELLTAWIF